MSAGLARVTAHRTLRLPGLGVSGRWHPRSVWVGACLLLGCLGVSLATLTVGSSPTPLGEVLAALGGAAENRSATVVLGWRLPRALFALVCGIALGASGAIFQSLTRNPLGSPDVIGFSAGSYLGALVVMLMFGSLRYAEIAAGALLGGVLTAAIVYALAYRGGLQGFRLIIVGIGVSAILGSVSSYLILTAGLKDAMTAATWGAGSLNGLAFEQFWPTLACLAVLAPAVLALGRGLDALALGDDAARAIGARPGWTGLSATLIGVALIAVVTAAAGPIAFVALAAPQIAARVTRAGGVGLVPAALTGALLLAVADLAAILVRLPVGVVTVSLGGSYLVWLLLRDVRFSRTTPAA